MQIWCHFTDGETSAGHWVQKRGIFMLAETDEKLHFIAEMGRQKAVFSRFYIRAICMVSFRGWLDCHVAECFVFALPLRKWVNKIDIDHTSQSCIDMTRMLRVIHKKMHWKKPKHLAKGYVSDAQSWHIKNIDPEIPKWHLFTSLRMSFIYQRVPFKCFTAAIFSSFLSILKNIPHPGRCDRKLTVNAFFLCCFSSSPILWHRGGARLRVRAALQQRLFQKEDENLADVQENSQQ